VTIRNSLPQSTSIHWHGLHIANDMDGVPDVTQRAIGPGETFVYEFVASHAGTFMYHPHNNREFTMMLGRTAGYFTINGKAFPATTSWTVKEGDLVRVRIVNISNLTHPMHLHGQDFKVVAP
jgi:FtsP/CotA-like multicopper oxidase with cupredoxin domain